MVGVLLLLILFKCSELLYFMTLQTAFNNKLFTWKINADCTVIHFTFLLAYEVRIQEIEIEKHDLNI